MARCELTRDASDFNAHRHWINGGKGHYSSHEVEFIPLWIVNPEKDEKKAGSKAGGSTDAMEADPSNAEEAEKEEKVSDEDDEDEEGGKKAIPIEVDEEGMLTQCTFMDDYDHRLEVALGSMMEEEGDDDALAPMMSTLSPYFYRLLVKRAKLTAAAAAKSLPLGDSYLRFKFGPHPHTEEEHVLAYKRCQQLRTRTVRRTFLWHAPTFS